jgi:peptidoglycan hydrolase-like protein with peptidoglycan-binding domain
MSTLQARLMLVAFVGLSAAITYNATSLQKGPHPAPMASEGHSSEKRAARKLSRTASIPKAPTQTDKTSAAPTRSQSVLTIQQKLAENGYDPGPADGVLGVMTRASIMAYQHDHGLRVTGIASTRLLKRMILGESIGDNDLGVSSAVPQETAALVKAVQMVLTNLKYEPGPADGIFGAATRSAIESFERDHKLAVKGRISAKLLKEIMQTSGVRFSTVYSG